MNVSRIVRYRELVKKQRVEELKLVEVDGVEEWEVEKILNKRKVRKVIRYLVCQRVFTIENVREVLDEFEERISVEVGQQKRVKRMWKEKINPNRKEFRRSELLEKYIAKILFGQNDRKFKDEYLKKLKRNQTRWKSVSPEKKS